VKAFDGYLLEKIDAFSKVTITSRLKQANQGLHIPYGLDLN